MLLFMVIFGIIIIPLALWMGGVYNSLVRRRQRIKEAWSDIDNQLKRRYNLIPNLVQVVKGYATHEKTTFENVAAARSRAMQAKGSKEKMEAENQLRETLKSLFAVVESYPQLKASENFRALQDELTDTENKIEAARRFYNANVRDYNIAIKVFPKNIIAGLFSFKSETLFEVKEEKIRAVPQVKF